MEQGARTWAFLPFAKGAHPMGGTLPFQYCGPYMVAFLADKAVVPLALAQIFLAIHVRFEGFGELYQTQSRKFHFQYIWYQVNEIVLKVVTL